MPVFSPHSRDELISASIRVYSGGLFPTKLLGPIGKWNVSQVTNMKKIFYDLRTFNYDLYHWDVSHVTEMRSMFAYARTFNQDLSNWEVSHVTNMNDMFYAAKAFNQNLSKWDVSQVTDMRGMFGNATSFQQTLCGAAWINSNASKLKMFANSSGSIYPACGAWMI